MLGGGFNGVQDTAELPKFAGGCRENEGRERGGAMLRSRTRMRVRKAFVHVLAASFVPLQLVTIIAVALETAISVDADVIAVIITRLAFIDIFNLFGGWLCEGGANKCII